VDPVTLVIAAIGAAVVNGLLAAYRNALILASAILGFSGAGIGMIIGSRSVTGWWQAALLGFGTSLLIVGTVQLGILGVVKKLLEPDNNVHVTATAVPRPGSTPTEIAAALRDLADRLDRGTATDNSPIKAVLDDL
jgi:hypothetical protein